MNNSLRIQVAIPPDEADLRYSKECPANNSIKLPKNSFVFLVFSRNCVAITFSFKTFASGAGLNGQTAIVFVSSTLVSGTLI